MNEKEIVEKSPDPIAPEKSPSIPVVPPFNAPRIMLGIGSGLILLGLFLPWTVFSDYLINYHVSDPGIVSEGIFGGILLLLPAFFMLISAIAKKGKPNKSFSITSGILAVFGIIYVIWRVMNLIPIMADIHMDYSMMEAKFGIGIWVDIIGLFLASLGGFIYS